MVEIANNHRDVMKMEVERSDEEYTGRNVMQKDVRGIRLSECGLSGVPCMAALSHLPFSHTYGTIPDLSVAAEAGSGSEREYCRLLAVLYACLCLNSHHCI